jgi:hypothetical protein
MKDALDAKGKYYTEVIHKRAVPARIQTVQHLILGTIYVQPEERVKDELNAAEDYLAVTDAKVLDEYGQEVLHATFLTINKSQIVWLAPEETQLPPSATSTRANRLARELGPTE